MKLSLSELRAIVNKELKLASLNERKNKEEDEDSGEVKEKVADALDVLEDLAVKSDDADEMRWYVTKIGDLFGLEPEEIDDEDE